MCGAIQSLHPVQEVIGHFTVFYCRQLCETNKKQYEKYFAKKDLRSGLEKVFMFKGQIEQKKLSK